MKNMHFVGLDVHKKTISYCLRQADGTIVREDTIASTRPEIVELVEVCRSLDGGLGSHDV